MVMSIIRVAHIAVLVALTMGSAGCGSPPVQPGRTRVTPAVELLSVTESRAKLDVSGYIVECLAEPSLFALENDKWVLVEQFLPFELFYLDDEWFGFWGACDALTCNLVTGFQPEARFVRYEQLGEKPAPDNQPEGLYPVYRTVPLTGTMKVTMVVYEDSDCQLKQTFEFVVGK